MVLVDQAAWGRGGCYSEIVHHKLVCNRPSGVNAGLLIGSSFSVSVGGDKHKLRDRERGREDEEVSPVSHST